VGPAGAHDIRMKTALVWIAALAIGAVLLVTLDYHSRDPDSALYARLSADLSARPLSQWIAPEWGGAWNQQGLFREHPVGILLPSALAARAGFPPGQAAYAVNMVYQAAAILLLPAVAALVMRRTDARALAWILQLLPVSFVYRIRANQEHPLLVCFLALVYATDRSRAHPAWIAVMAVSFCWLALIKGAFAMFALTAAGLWLLVVPPSDGGLNRRGWIGLALSALMAIVIVAVYEQIYTRVTGQSFLAFYRTTRLGESMDLGDPRIVAHALRNIVWYLIRLAWFAAPWSLAAFAVWLAWLRSPRAALDVRSDRRAALWALWAAIVFIVVLSPANVRAERFIFPVYFIAGALGFAAAARRFAPVEHLAARTAEYWWLPPATWLVLFLANIGSRALR
jgi:hypothetical protein